MKDTQIELGTHNEIIKAENLISALKIPSNIELQLYGNLSVRALLWIQKCLPPLHTVLRFQGKYWTSI